MNEIVLKINQDEKYEFFCLFDKLSKLRKEVWKLIVWWCKRFTTAQPSQTRIAEKLGCCRSAVSEAFKLFKTYGWMFLTSRGFKKSKILGIPQHLQQIDLVNREYFRRVEATYRATHSYSNIKKNTSKACEIKIPFYLEKKDLPLEVKLKLSLVPENVYQETYHQCKNRFKAGFRPRNDFKYFVDTALGIAKNNAIKINWPSYYRTLEKRPA